jgi:predicted DNA-binding transcriptional regulator AlpA
MNDNNNEKKPERLLLWQGVHHRVGFSKQYMYVLMKKGQFPTPIKITEGGRLNAWRESDIDSFIASRVSAAQAVKS